MRHTTILTLILCLLQAHCFGFALHDQSLSCVLHYRIDANSSPNENDCSILKVGEGSVDINTPDPVNIDIPKKYTDINPTLCISISLQNSDHTTCSYSGQDNMLVFMAADSCVITLSPENKILMTDSCKIPKDKEPK